jgi:Family of unknown function (DUF6518)
VTALARAWPAVALAIGLAAGIATSYLQGVLPGSWNTLANSGAVWTVVAFVVAALVVQTRGLTVASGLAALLGEVLGYYAIASPVRGIATSTSERALWVAAAIIGGPLIGWAAWWWRRGRPTARLAAILAICGVVVGEGVHGLLRISATSPAHWTEVILGSVVALVLVIRSSAPWRDRLVPIGVGVLSAAAVAVVYGETVLH